MILMANIYINYLVVSVAKISVFSIFPHLWRIHLFQIADRFFMIRNKVISLCESICALSDNHRLSFPNLLPFVSNCPVPAISFIILGCWNIQKLLIVEWMSGPCIIFVFQTVKFLQVKEWSMSNTTFMCHILL